MKLLAVAFASCITFTTVFAQSVVPVTVAEIPENYRGDYVLISRSCSSEGDKIESFKEHPKPFCKIESNRVILADGQILQATRVGKVVEKDLVTCLLTFDGVDYGWGMGMKPPYVFIAQRQTFSRQMKKAIAMRTTNAVPEVCGFKVQKIAK
jgi:hypothetical protein